MVDGESWEPGLADGLERVTAARSEAERVELVSPGWRGPMRELGDDALEAFWAEAVRYARREIGHYAAWRKQDEPVLADGYDAEGVVQAAFERLMQREGGRDTVEARRLPANGLLSKGPSSLPPASKALRRTGQPSPPLAARESGPILYSAEDIRHALRALIKHRVRWLHERSETRLAVGEWDVLPPRADDELVSIFDYLPGRLGQPDTELMRKEKEQLLGEFKEGFEATLKESLVEAPTTGRVEGIGEEIKIKSEDERELLEVFRRVWDGQKRREVARELGAKVPRVKAIQAQLRRRLAKFGAEARGGVAEMLEGMKRGG
jgi:DNA-directed RNA polymerase specialized sigma24 family protein